MTRQQLEDEAKRRNEEASAKPGPYQHWFVRADGYGDFLSCEWRRVPVVERIRGWLIGALGGRTE